MSGVEHEGVAAAASVLGSRARRHVALGPLTTYRVGGPAALFVEVGDLDDLELVAAAVSGSGVPVLVVGKGSNLLVAEAGFPGLVVVLGEGWAGIEISGDTVLAGAAAGLPVLARRTAAAGLTGLEWAVGVPGSVGGGVRMNAGGHGSDVAATLAEVRVVDLTTCEHGVVPAAHLALGYRRSVVGASSVIVQARFTLSAGDPTVSAAEIADIVRWRRQHQPGGQNAGSVFTNPPGDSAGRLVDATGLRGHRRGSARVSEKHANFIQSDVGGSADDVLALIGEVQAAVRRSTGIRLVPEVRLVGFADLGGLVEAPG